MKAKRNGFFGNVRLVLPTMLILVFSAIAVPVSAFPGVTTSGNPVPPTTVAYNTSYSISVTVTCTGGETGVIDCCAESNLGTNTGPNWFNPWSPTPTWTFNGGPNGTHTFTVANYEHVVYVWWRGRGRAFAPPNNQVTGIDPNPIGFFYTS